MPKSLRSMTDFYIGVAFLSLIIFAGCASSDLADERSERSTHQPASHGNERSVNEGTVYVDDIELITDNDTYYLLIEGSLPSPCHNLSHPSMEQDGNSLYITLNSWRDADAVCSQVLEPLVYYLELDHDSIANLSEISVNDVTIEI